MELSLASSPFVVLLLAFLYPALLIFFKRRSPTSPANGCATLKSYPLLGNLPHLIKNSRRLLEWSAELILASPNATVTVAPIVFTGNPSNVEHLAKANFGNYPKSGVFLSPVRDLLGRGILNVNGEEWYHQRKTSRYVFSTKSLRAFVLEKVHHELVDRLFPLLSKASQVGDIFNLQDVLERFAFDTICCLVLGEDPKCLGGGSEEGERFFRAFGEATYLSVERSLQPLPLVWMAKKWLDVGSERRLRDSMTIVRRFVERCVRSRREQASGGDDGGSGSEFISRFDQDNANSDELIYDILINFVLAGRDTTPSALTWFFWVLSSQPHVVNEIREEIKRIRSRRAREDDSGAAFTLEELREMNYLHASISESLRLYPPVPLVPKECKEEDELPGGAAVVRKGWIVMYNAYAMGRREEIWGADCGEFKPERWLKEGVFQPRNPAMYPVFHGGPRMCIGKDVAYAQMKALAASMLERFELEVVEGSGRHQLLITMRMEGGLLVRVKEKDGHHAPGP